MRFITLRRYYLDQNLANINFYGDVLDIGGKKSNKRGFFNPKLLNVKSWLYLNNDKDALPDILCSAEDISLGDNHFNFVVMTEVVEYIDNYYKALEEAHRILVPGGTLVLSAPLFSPIHGDLGDRYRFTEFKLIQDLNNLGFYNINLKKMGSITAVFYDFLLSDIRKHRYYNFIFLRILRKIFRFPMSRIVLFFDRFLFKGSNSTTGYFILCEKNI
jgi:SAM-dependent methyltransferase